MINKERKENPYYSDTEENIVRGKNLKVHLRDMDIEDILNRLKLGEELTLNGEVLELPTDHMWGEYPHEDYIEYLTVLKECYYSKLLIDSISSLYGLDGLKTLIEREICDTHTQSHYAGLVALARRHLRLSGVKIDADLEKYYDLFKVGDRLMNDFNFQFSWGIFFERRKIKHLAKVVMLGFNEIIELTDYTEESFAKEFKEKFALYREQNPNEEFPEGYPTFHFELLEPPTYTPDVFVGKCGSAIFTYLDLLNSGMPAEVILDHYRFGSFEDALTLGNRFIDDFSHYSNVHMAILEYLGVTIPLELREVFDVKKYFDDVIYQKYYISNQCLIEKPHA